MSLDQKMLDRLVSINKLLYMQTRPKIEELKKELIKTPQQKKAYDALEGTLNIKEIAQAAGYTDTRMLETMLPQWETKGFILSIGKGPNKRYVNIENLEV